MEREAGLWASVRESLGALRARPGELWLIACSGGPDSLCLLVMAAALRPDLGVRLGAVYIDHGLRPAAAAEAELVRHVADGLGVPTEVRRVEAAARARRDRRSLMEAARLERYDALSAAAAAGQATRVLLGHTADDQIETLAMRLLRGTGLRGLCGMPARRGLFARPLIDVRRKAIEEFLAARGLCPVRDPSNEDRRFLRPLVRHEMLPALRGRVPQLDAILLGIAAHARALCGALDERLEAEPPAATLSVAALREASAGERELRLARAFAQAGGGGLCAAHLAALDRLCASSRGTRAIDLPGGLRAERRYGTLVFVPRTPRGEGDAPLIAIPALTPLHCHLLGHEFSIDLCSQGAGPEPDPRDLWTAWFDADALRYPLALRPARHGDRIQPRGFAHRRKLSDVLGEARVPAPVRRRLPLLADDTEVLFVPGVRASERARPRADSSRLLRVRARGSAEKDEGLL